GGALVRTGRGPGRASRARAAGDRRPAVARETVEESYVRRLLAGTPSLPRPRRRLLPADLANEPGPAHARGRRRRVAGSLPRAAGRWQRLGAHQRRPGGPGLRPDPGPSGARGAVLDPAFRARPMKTLTEPELISQLQEAFASFLGMDPAEVDPEQSIDELGMDSLTAAQLAVEIEERLGVSVFLNDLTGRETITGLAASLLRES